MAKYEVSWYENFGGPPKFRDEGEFDTADEALRCAHRIIDESLEGLM
jgi:hypothetical protein